MGMASSGGGVRAHSPSAPSTMPLFFSTHHDPGTSIRVFMSSYPMILELSMHRRAESGTRTHHEQLEPLLGLSLRSGSTEIVLPSSDNNSSSSSSKNSGIIRQLSHFRHGKEGVCGPLEKMITSVTKGSIKGKMIAREQEMQGLTDDNSCEGAIRMCSNCNTTKTPLWRSGPWGPKSLCNACGIRLRKAKQPMEVAAAAAAAAAAIVTISSNKNPRSKPHKELEEKKREESCFLPFKKRFKITNL